jgi:hypothetical protein
MRSQPAAHSRNQGLHVAAGLAFLSLLVLAGRCGAQTVAGADEILQRLKANDARFDRVLVECDYTRHEWVKHRQAVALNDAKLTIDKDIDPSTVPPQAELAAMCVKYFFRNPEIELAAVPQEARQWVQWMREGKISFAIPAPPAESEEKTLSHDQFCIRWPDLAVRKVFGPGVETKYSMVGQQMQHLYPVACSSASREWFHQTETDVSFPNVYHEQATWLKFALGIGYSEVIGKVTAVEMGGGRQVIDVEIHYGSLAPGKGKLQLDSSGLVRSADLTFGDNRIVVATTGTYNAAQRGFRCAKTGFFTRHRGAKEKPETKFDVTVQSIQFDLPEARFDEIADMESPLDEPRYEIEKGGVRQVRDRAPAKPTQ